MNLLPKKTRIKYFKDLGLGEYNKANIEKVQRRYFSNPKEWDGRWGKHTDALIRHLHNVWKACKDFKPEEFKCKCGKCTGYPVQMKVKELKHIQRIRDHYGKAMTITSGLRCEYQNRKVGGLSDSKHLSGYAVDFYMPGVTDTLERRRNAVKFIKTLPNHYYTYGDGIASTGAHVSRPGMGNALHTDTK